MFLTPLVLAGWALASPLRSRDNSTSTSLNESPTSTQAEDVIATSSLTSTSTSLSSATATNNPKTYILSNDFDITDTPTTREYYWTIDTYSGAPDGFVRQVYAINGQIPGPTIEANQGDRIVVHVTNLLPDGQSIHWHGIDQNGTQWMDGVAGFTQCPIPSGGTFTYNFTINQFGTFWYHSHYGNTLADGLYGALIVHSVNDPLQRGRDYDEERLLLVQDWVHDMSEVVVNALKSPQGYKGGILPPEGDSILLNGAGVTNCSDTPGCTTPSPAEIHVPIGKRIRVRLISALMTDFLRVSMDEHKLEIVELDDCPIYGPTIVETGVNPGQRTSFIINTKHGKAGDAFWIRASRGIGCTGEHPYIGKAILRYVNHQTKHTNSLPRTSPWPGLAAPNATCHDLDENHIVTPRVAVDAPTDILTTVELHSQLGKFVDVTGAAFTGFGWNGTTFQNQINYPLLQQIENGLTLNSSLVAAGTFPHVGGGDIIINNLDPFDHPYHAHGRAFSIVGRGSGMLLESQLPGITLNLTNPLRRDTIHIPAKSWAVLRLVTDDPGVWALHCHLGWHLSVGKMAALVIQPDAVRNFQQPADWLGLCAGTDPEAFGP
ncbi:multi-copper oxidase laccase-like protein, partial [Tremella mesenterica DSM 1558]|uniref:multi-copper oxidase laccase-like protein n=1 Tax=Tremella mesenterica (strain ATCC 24925 / CBS 8224 / DSM 1558 / NBRC 9311 / NRRL Y-6157 / RJB 2259-6 / UBC 559-6) TaxID=578456 RepID=UPI0003F48E0F